MNLKISKNRVEQAPVHEKMRSMTIVQQQSNPSGSADRRGLRDNTGSHAERSKAENAAPPHYKI